MSTVATTSMVLLYAGFWRRVAAATLDGFVLLVPSVILILVVHDQLLQETVNILIGCAYYAGFHRSIWQATPGKRAFGIKVTNYDGGRIGSGRAIGRYFAAWLSLILLVHRETPGAARHDL
jgi:uncharacterized RDD family membrane protein YckC